MAILSPEVVALMGDMEKAKQEIEELKQVVSALYIAVEELKDALEGE